MLRAEPQSHADARDGPRANLTAEQASSNSAFAGERVTAQPHPWRRSGASKVFKDWLSSRFANIL
jgi:hypothetical protein